MQKRTEQENITNYLRHIATLTTSLVSLVEHHNQAMLQLKFGLC